MLSALTGLCGVIDGGGGGGSGGGGGTWAAAASTLNIRAHSLHDTVRPGRKPPGSGLMCPQCMQAITSSPAGRQVLRLVEHQVLEQMREPGLAALLVARTDPVPGVVAEQRRRGVGQRQHE